MKHPVGLFRVRPRNACSSRISTDLLALARAVGVPLAESTSVSGTGYPGYQANAFRLRFADGRLLKGRQFAAVKRAATVEYVARHIAHPGFPKVLARINGALLSEWIEGHPLCMTDMTPALLRRCGALHGFMHSVPLPLDCPYRFHTTSREWCDELAQRLEELATAGILKPGEAQCAFDRAIHSVPNSCDGGFVHRDFCAENMVVCPTGQVWVIDNETVGVDAYDYDLGRTWYRWPMSWRQRQAYLEGYRVYRSPDAFLSHLPFWSIVAIVGSAVFRLRRQRDGASEPAERLRGMLSHLARSCSAEERAFLS